LISRTSPEEEDIALAETVTIQDFENVDIRVGRIVSARPLAGARKPAYELRIDFGPEFGIKQSSAQLTVHYQAEELPGRLVLAVVNFPPRRIAGFRSEVLTLGVPDEDGNVVLIAPTTEVPLGGKLF
jgi:tRNA-binding protein